MGVEPVPATAYLKGARPAHIPVAGEGSMRDPSRRSVYAAPGAEAADWGMPFQAYCEGVTKDGGACKAFPVGNGRFCVFHEKGQGEYIRPGSETE